MPKFNFKILNQDIKTAFNTASKNIQSIQREIALGPNPPGEHTRKEFSKAAKAFLKAHSKVIQQEKAMERLFRAADNGNINVLKQAFSQGIDVNFMNLGGNTLISYAARSDARKAVDYLLAEKADVNLKGYLGFSALEQATIANRAVIFKKLVEHSSKTNINKLSKLARQNGSKDILKLIG